MIAASPAWSQEMDFGEEDPPPEGGVEVSLDMEGEEPPAAPEETAEPPRTQAYAFAITNDEELRQIAQELDSAMRDTLAGNASFSSGPADGQLNGFDRRSAEALRQATELFDSGRIAYENLEFDEATERFTQALETYEEQTAHVTDFNDISECLLYLGAAAALNGDSRQARTYFQRLLIIDPERRPDADVFPPQVTEAFEYEVGRMDRLRDGLINVSSQPEGSVVYVDGIYQGPAPQELGHFKAGRHYVRVRRQGYIEAGQAVDVGSRRPTNLEFTLEETALGPVISSQLDDLAAGLVAESDESVEMVQALGQALSLEVLVTALVTRSDEGVMVRMNSWNIATGRSIAQEALGPFEADGVTVAGDVQPSFDEMLETVDRAINTRQADDVPLIDQRPDVPPPPPPPPRAFWQRWWFWTIIGAAVVGTGVGLGVGLGTQQDPPGRTQGEVIFDL